MSRKNKKILFIISCVCVCIMGIAMPVIANTSSRRANIKSTGNLDFENGKVYFAASDLTYLADEIDYLEDTYKQTTVDALNDVGTYFLNDGTITYDFSFNEVDTDEEKSALSFGKITEGIRKSQSLQSVEQIQATDDEGNLLYYETEEAQTNKDLYSLTTTDTGFPAYYQAANANNLSAGTAAWVDGTLIKGNGSDNAAYIEQGYRAGYTQGIADGLSKVNVQYTYHVHEGNTTDGGACYTSYTYTVNGGSHNIVGTGKYSGSNEYYQCVYCGKGEYSCNIPKYFNPNEACSKNIIYMTGYQLGCGKTENTIESATIIF